LIVHGTIDAVNVSEQAARRCDMMARDGWRSFIGLLAYDRPSRRLSTCALRNLNTSCSRPLVLTFHKHNRSVGIGLTYQNPAALSDRTAPRPEIPLNLVGPYEIADRLPQPTKEHQDHDEQDDGNCESTDRGKNVQEHLVMSSA
jgi:hypothetical protein